MQRLNKESDYEGKRPIVGLAEKLEEMVLG